MSDKKPRHRSMVKGLRGESVQRDNKQAAIGTQTTPTSRKKPVEHQQGEAGVQDSQRLLLAVTRLQSLFINEAMPEALFSVLLEELLSLADSEYGFIGEVLRTAEGQPYLRTHAITDITWNEETRALLAEHAPTLEFRNLKTLFGHVMTTGKPVIANDPAHDPRTGGFPPGHPPMQAFLGLPFFHGGVMTGMVGVANRPGGYDEALVAYLQPFLRTTAQLVEGFRGRRLRGEAEEALRISEERWQLAVHGSHDGIWDWDLTSNVVYFSPRWKEMLGYGEHEINGEYREWESRLHPEDRERVLSQLNAYLERRTALYHVEFRLCKKNGEYCWIEARGKAMWDAEGRPYRMAGSHTDISARMQVEQTLLEAHLAVESAMEGIAKFDDTGRYLSVNQQYAARLGYSPEELLGQSWEITVHPDDRASVLTSFARMRETGKAESEIRGLKRDGGLIYEQVMIVECAESGKRSGHFCFMRDVTERKREDALQAAEKQALELVAKGTVLNDVLAFICRAIETHTPPMLCSIMLVTKDGTKLSLAAGPSLPDEYNQAVGVIPIGPTVGSCGSAAHFKTPSIVTDIATDPLWKDYASVVLLHGLKACWSHPILGSTGTLLGTFAAYYRETRSPQPTDLKIVERASHIAALAVEHAKVSEALRESEARFKAFMHYCPMISFIKDEGCRYLYVNPTFERRFHVSLDEVRGKTNDELMPSAAAAELNENDRRVLSTREAIEVEETVPMPDGHSEQWLVLKFPLKGAQGESLLGGVAVDITERKRVEEYLRRTQFAMDQAVDAVYWIDPQARILYANEAASAMLGYTADEFLRMTVHDLNPDFPPEVWPGWWEETREKKVISLETNHLTKDGRRIPIDIRVSFLAYDGQEFHCAFVRNITERKRVEAARETLQYAVDRGMEGLALLDGEGRYTYMNEAHAKIYGFNVSELIGCSWETLYVAEQVARIQSEILPALQSAQRWHGELVGRTKTGAFVHVEMGLQLLPQKGVVSEVLLCKCRDITARKQAEIALQQAHEELEQRVDERTEQLAMVNRALLDEIAERMRVEDRLQRTQYAVDHASDQIFLIGPGGYFEDVNEAACRRLGYTKDELLTMSVMDIDPDFSAEVWREFWERFVRTGQLRLETRHRSKSGDVYPVEVVANYLCHGGQELDYAIVRDITDRRQAEEAIRESEFRYKLLTEATFDGIAIHDQGILLEVNAGLERMFGYEAGELIGRPIWDLIAEESRSLVMGNMQNGANGPYEAMGRRKDGSIFPGEVVVRPCRYKGKAARLVAGRDITERKHLEAARVRYTEELERQVVQRTAEVAKLEFLRAQTEKLAAMGRLAAGVAHEINNPIAGIKNAFTLVRQAVDPAHPSAEFVGMIDREIARVASIVQNMYQLYRPDSRRGEMVDLWIMAKDLDALLAPQLKQRRLKLVVNMGCSPQRLCVVQGDLLQVLLNLLTNAIDCSPEGGTITFSLHEEAEWVRLIVSDQGEGIRADVLPKIFDPFFTTKTGRDQKGMGLGLSISQSLVLAMGGKIEVATELHQGSTFTVLLPRKLIEVNASDQSNIIKEVVTHDC